MHATDAGVLAVTGAHLYHEVRGEGPALLLIPGGNGDAGGFTRVAEELAGGYRVISYDRRGFSRSPLSGPPDDDARLDLDVADAVSLIDSLAGGPACVFGSSSGAIVALELLIKHPDRIRVLVAHEPPLFGLLPDADQQFDLMERVYATYRRAGVGEAMREFGAAVGLPDRAVAPPGVELPPEVAELLARIERNQEFWLEHELRQYPRDMPDLGALRAAGSRLVLAGGSESRVHRHLPYRPVSTLAERLGTEVTEFPGGHIGYAIDPSGFARRLVEVLGADRG